MPSTPVHLYVLYVAFMSQVAFFVLFITLKVLIQVNWLKRRLHVVTLGFKTCIVCSTVE